MKPVSISLSKLETWNPFNASPWREIIFPIRKFDIENSLLWEDFEEEFYSSNWTYEKHVQRIAYFVNNNFDPIDLDVGCPSLGHYVDNIIMDGHHRLAAAFFRGDKNIMAYISGEEEYSKELLGY